jgi:hypothetical protein
LVAEVVRVYLVVLALVGRRVVQELLTKVMQVVVVRKVETRMVNQAVVVLVVLVMLQLVRLLMAAQVETVFLLT